MLVAQSPSQLAMTNDFFDDDHHVHWNAWRAPTSNLPTPPSSDPPRRLGSTKQHCAAGHGPQPRAGVYLSVDGSHQQHLTLPPIAYIDRHWPTSSPLTPPDDDMHSSPITSSDWRDTKPGPSQMHSPMNTHISHFLASPSPSPIDEDERYDEPYDAMDGHLKAEGEDWAWERQQGQDVSSALCGSNEETSQAHASNSSAADWVTNPSQRSAHFIAEKTCEMVCYLWFSSSLGPRAIAASRARREREKSQRRRSRDASAHVHSPAVTPRSLSNASTAALQFCASPEFVAFMAKLLATTQVSQSVIVLSLHYIFRLKERNEFTLGKPGSEFRVAVCALMLANKFVDDNTYTNKTWSEVSAIPLEELNKMEREFLLGVNFQLFVDAQTYDAWLNLLKGLVLTKEREYTSWRLRRRTRVIVPRIRIPDANERMSREEQRTVQRARSTSPHHSRDYSYAPAYPFTFSVPSAAAAQLQVTSQAYGQSHSAQTSPNRPISSKRTAADAFSPTSATFAGSARSGKRPTGLALDIPAALASASTSSNSTQQRTWERTGSVSAHPAYTYADSLQRLEKMSLATPVDQQPDSDTREMGRVSDLNGRRNSEEQTLAAPYRGIEAARRAPPPHLYFYALASSPLTSPYVASAAEYEQPQTAVYDTANDAAVPLERPATKEGVNVLPPGAERKVRLRYVDSRTGGHGYEYNSYGYAAAQGSQVSYGHQMSYPAPTTTHRSSDTYSEPHAVQYPQSQRVHSQGQQHQQHLPPLALALSMAPATSRVPVVQSESTRTSPLPGFASLDSYAIPPPSASSMHSHSYMQPQPQPQPQDAHVSYSVPQTYASPIQPSTSYVHSSAAPLAPAPAVQSAWSAPPTETVDGIYAPVPRHVHPHSHQQPTSNQQSQPIYSYKSYASPTYTFPQYQQQHQSIRQDTVPPSSSFTSGLGYISQGQGTSLAERAAFANAGPPGVAHFYQYARSSGSLSNTDGDGGAYNSNVATGCGHSTAALQQSQSVTASPEGHYGYGYDYAMRLRRL